MGSVEIDDYITDEAADAGRLVLEAYGLTQNEAFDAASDVLRAAGPQLLAKYLGVLAARGGETFAVNYIDDLAQAWERYEHPTV